ncbi:MAG: hypothetical protein GX146_01035 [Myxococcales bacterium]|nr:hypothetical protein [Myxococcales bacterium]
MEKQILTPLLFCTLMALALAMVACGADNASDSDDDGADSNTDNPTGDTDNPTGDSDSGDGTDAAPILTCGNGALEPPETCDGDDLGGETCTSLGYTGGTLACAANCIKFDTSACTGTPPGGDTEAPCVPKTCLDHDANCGELDDGCGAPLQCGTCEGELTCGGAGLPNVCGTTCGDGCPEGFTCSLQGVCAGGDLSNLVLNVPLATLSISFTLNGETARPSGFCVGPGLVSVIMRNLKTSEQIEFQLECEDPITTYILPHGTYEVTVKNWYDYARDIPDIMRYVVHEELEVTGDMTLPIDLKLATLRFSATVNGEPLESGNGCANRYVWITLQNKQTGESTVLELECFYNYTLEYIVPHGTYSVGISRGNWLSPPNLPDILTYIAYEALTVSGDRDVPINIPLAELTFRASTNGEPLVADPHCNSIHKLATIYVTNQQTGETDEVTLPCDYPARYVVPHGTYEISIADPNGATANLPYDLMRYEAYDKLEVSGDMDVPIDIPVATLTLSATVNGEPLIPASSCKNYNLADIIFENLRTAEQRTVGLYCAGGNTRTYKIPHGTYRVSIQNNSGNAQNLPDILPHLAYAELEVTGDQALPIDIPLATLKFSATVNGEALVPSASCNGIATVSIKNLLTGAETLQNLSCSNGTRIYTLPKGDYQIMIRNNNWNATNLPEIMWYLAHEKLTVNRDMDVPIDIPLETLKLRATVNSEPLVPVSYCGPQNRLARVFIRHLKTNEVVDFGLSCDDDTTAYTIPHGSYEFSLQNWDDYAENLPDADIFRYVSIWRLSIP